MTKKKKCVNEYIICVMLFVAYISCKLTLLFKNTTRNILLFTSLTYTCSLVIRTKRFPSLCHFFLSSTTAENYNNSILFYFVLLRALARVLGHLLNIQLYIMVIFYFDTFSHNYYIIYNYTRDLRSGFNAKKQNLNTHIITFMI